MVEKQSKRGGTLDAKAGGVSQGTNGTLAGWLPCKDDKSSMGKSAPNTQVEQKKGTLGR